ncbi:PREDICTED: small RNA degrading nuclease 5-like [Branchiostoma belcheri]|uniref:Small RNA degrading nuclease 5-like n=1 Tax=Branchiostoma belcheri TaxID=7741 RepID=A0A6P4YTY7_BRABE|nr:PREDICTED: small RNA degrading nuclease 5-like [Branchiostoma belcheri]
MGKKGKNKRSKRGHGVSKNAKHLARRGEKRRKTETEDTTEEKPAKKLRRFEAEERAQDGACTPEGQEQRLKKLRVDDDTPVPLVERLTDGSETNKKKKKQKKKKTDCETSQDEGRSAGEGHLGDNLSSDDVMAPQGQSQGPENSDTKHQKNKNKSKKETSSQDTQAVLHLTLNNLEGEFRLAQVQQLLLHAFLGKRKSAPWCQIQNFNKLRKVVLVVLNGVSSEHLAQHPECFAQLAAMFPNKKVPLAMKVADSRPREFMRDLLRVPVSKTAQKKLGKDLENGVVDPDLVEKSASCAKHTGEKSTVGRTHFLLNREQLRANRFPLDTDTALSEGFVSFETCTPTDTSPMYAIDCEMCETEVGKELTRISVVGEDLKTVYNSLVKPRRLVKDYMTQFSGICEKDLKDVTTRLEHVQEMLQELLPPDGILVGHSLENDLQALKMIHPHVIDTSLLFNHPTWRFKPKLRTLASKLLGKEIQTGTGGHDSVEDAAAAMQLVQLKIANGPSFLLDHGGANSVSDTESYFRVLAREKKTATMVDTASCLKPFLGHPVHCVPVVSDREALAKAQSEIRSKHFVWVQLHSWHTVANSSMCEPSILAETLARLCARVCELYNMVPENSLFVVLTTGAESVGQLSQTLDKGSQENVQIGEGRNDQEKTKCSHGLCYLTVKKC